MQDCANPPASSVDAIPVLFHSFLGRLSVFALSLEPFYPSPPSHVWKDTLQMLPNYP